MKLMGSFLKEIVKEYVGFLLEIFLLYPNSTLTDD
jgi:hypothetical protein